ncbi:hypothetical protein CUJ83_01495 [Methanocella sp. CWC-04]|uniref:Trk K+ transport system, NAD-binding component n=1 Tax=Methanooceanicella nereidis TaxID=2052831 RepID=A0AAP2W4T4_9EURY|nr:NAD-binding protein [Methanocella sp. CWC-04]MCD1293668.1 hypothetical protein [Methanocella sp. CWC-04]
MHKISGIFSRRALKSRYLLYPIAIITIVLIYARIFLLLKNDFNVQDPDFLTAIYWVITTMTTTGFGDIVPMTQAGQIFSTIVIITGIIIFFAIVLPLLVTPIMEKWIRSPVSRLPDWMKEHVVICGYNALVDSLVKELASEEKPFAVVDESLDHVLMLQRRGYYAIQGDPSDEDILKMAHIERASAMIANSGDPKNAAIVLTASQLSKCYIVALVENLDMAHYLEFAGADVVVSPKKMLGINIGASAVSSINLEVTNIVDIGGDMKICKLPIYPDNPMIGKKLMDLGIRERTGATIVAVFRNGEFTVNPLPKLVIRESMVLVAMGTMDQLKNISTMARVKNFAKKGKCIIAGFGDVGQEVAKRFDERKIPYTVIDIKEYPGVEQVVGNSTDRDILIKAGIEDAFTLIVTLNNDDKNMLTTLLARNLNPHINIVSRANLDRSVAKLYRAGADYVMSLSTIGGQMLARIVESGEFEGAVPISEDVLLSRFNVKGSKLEGKTIRESMMRARSGCTILGVIEDHKFYPSPDPSMKLNENMTIIAVGTLRQLDTCLELYDLKEASEEDAISK